MLIIWPLLLSMTSFPEAPQVSLLTPFIVPAATRPLTHPRDRDEVLHIGEHLARTIQGHSLYQAIEVKLLTFQLLLTLIENHPAPTLYAPTITPGMYETIMPAIQLAMTTKTLISRESAAEVCSMSASHFARVFRIVTGITFAKFALRHRLSGVVQAMRETDLPLTSIAEAWGFTDESHLYHHFQTHFGVSPRTYRQTLDAQ